MLQSSGSTHASVIAMKAFVCIVLLAAAALAAPEGKRDKRGYLHGGYNSLSLQQGLELGHSSLDFGHGHISHGAILSEPIYTAPAKVVSYDKVVSVPKIVEVQKIISVPKVVSVPQIVKVSKIVEAPHYSHGLTSGWW